MRRYYKEPNDNVRPYFNIDDVEEMYEALNGSRKGITSFTNDAREIASKNKYGRSLVFKNEEALFELFKERLPEQLARKKITCFVL